MKPTYNFLIIITLILLSNISYSQSVPSYVPTNGLVGWWGFNGNAQDGSGNGNPGTVNGATLTTDRFGNQNGAYDFDGNDWIVANPVNIMNNFSISTWILANSNIVSSEVQSNSNSGATYLSQGSSNSPCNYPDFGLGLKSGPYFSGSVICNETYFNFERGNACSFTHYADCNPNFTQFGTWQHSLYTFDGSNLKFYLNGLLQWSQTNALPILNSGFPLSIGCRLVFNNPDIAYGYWNGKLDDIGIWNRALSPQEITNIYNSQLPTQTSLCLPTITTSSPSTVGVDSVVIGGDISNDGGSSIVLRGVCYSTTPNPNMGNMRTEDGSGIGSFNTVLRGLNPSTTYYARSYAKNSNEVVVYGNEVSISTSSKNIGSNYAGGIVFYVDSTGQHGLVCAPNDQGFYQWGCMGTNIGGTSMAFGTGQVNTNLILSGCPSRPIAASVCADLVLNGYSDWYLPSLGELQLMYPNLHVQGIGGFVPTGYWSSTQRSVNEAEGIAFDDGSTSIEHHKGNGGNQNWVTGNRVRAVRTF